MTSYAEVIGDPIAHSKSPIIHGHWLARLGLPGDYRAVHVRPDGLEGYFASRAADPAWRGCNITLPHKLAALDHVPDPGGVRASIGAANTVARDTHGALFATNTDAGGFLAPIADLPLAGETAIMIGAGGAARACLFALKQAGVGKVVILARSPLKAMGLLSALGLTGDVEGMDARLPPARLPPARLIVNASPLGMVGQPPLALDLDGQADDCVVYDIVYAPLETPLLAAARARGLETVDGLEMLVAQAALAFELFFGLAPPDDDSALRALLTA